jgi:hypothetical protein
MKEYMSFQGYIGNARYSDDDEVYHGKLLYVTDVITYEADTADKIEAAFQEAVQHYLTTCVSIGDLPNNPKPDNFIAIADAPRDGTHISVIRPEDSVGFEAWFDQSGTSYIDGLFIQTGTWSCMVGGWFERDEVHYWIPLK